MLNLFSSSASTLHILTCPESITRGCQCSIRKPSCPDNVENHQISTPPSLTGTRSRRLHTYIRSTPQSPERERPKGGEGGRGGEAEPKTAAHISPNILPFPSLLFSSLTHLSRPSRSRPTVPWHFISNSTAPIRAGLLQSPSPPPSPLP